MNRLPLKPSDYLMAERSQWLPKLRRIVLTLLILYLVVCGIVMLAQRRMIYLPTRVNQAVAEKWAAGSQLQPWTNAVGEGIGWKRLVKESVGQVLIIHGNAGCALDRDFYADKIQEVDRLNIFILNIQATGAGEVILPSRRSWQRHGTPLAY